MKVPLLEYLDKLEAKDKADIAFCGWPAACSEHHEIPTRLALIAKLREAVAFLDEIEAAAFDGGVSKRLADLKTIEVPE